MLDNMFELPKHEPELEEQILERVLKAYPNIKVGGRMLGPVGLVNEDGQTTFDYNAIICGAIATRTINFNLPLDEITIAGLEHAKYIHPYQANGLNIIDSVTLSPQMKVVFRYAVSGLPEPSKDITVEREHLENINNALNNAKREFSYIVQDIKFTKDEYIKVINIEAQLSESIAALRDLLLKGSFNNI